MHRVSQCYYSLSVIVWVSSVSKWSKFWVRELSRVVREVFCEVVYKGSCLLCGQLAYRIFLLWNVAFGYGLVAYFGRLKSPARWCIQALHPFGIATFGCI